MPKLGLGEKAPHEKRGYDYLELESKGQKVYVRFLGGPVYDGKHFLQNPDGTWDVFYCPRIMHEKECAYCERYFAALKDIKELKKEDESGNKKKIKALEKVARSNNVNISYYFPVIERNMEEAKILKTTKSVKWKLDEEVENGIKVLDYDYIITRTEDPGAAYYSLTRLDSSQIKPLTEKEEEALKKAKSWDLEEIVISKDSSMEFGEDVKEEEDVDLDEIM